MLRTIFLLSPVFVSLLWSVTLAGNSRKFSNPRIFLGRFMLLPLLIFTAHFLYFAPLPGIYSYFDIALQCASLLVFPAYYIYFRLLTVDDNFSLKAHYKFLVVPAFLTILYSTGVILTPKAEYNAWLFNENAFPYSSELQYLKVIRIVIRLTYLIQVILTVSGNIYLIRKYSSKAEQFYSNVDDGKYNNARALNYSIIIISIGSIGMTALGRHFLFSEDIIIYLAWSVFTAMLFIIGYLGIRLKPINPTFEVADTPKEQIQTMDITPAAQRKILEKLKIEFDQKKVYLNSQLNIMDLVETIGTNRTYISMIINQQYNQNFCSFVNSYRIEELKRIYVENPSLSTEMLAEKGGFGSVNSMKRAIFNKTALSFAEWKNQQLSDKTDVIES